MSPALPETGGREWMGCRPSTPDSLPVIGAHPGDPRILFAFGHGHLGLTLSAATARHVAVAGRRPSRSEAQAVRDRALPVTASRAIVRRDQPDIRHAQDLLLHRRPYLRQSGPRRRRRRPAARRRHHEREAPGLPRPLRLDPHRPDVRAARPRRHVGHDPLRADARRHRLRAPLHRDQRLPADVRPRRDRHGHRPASRRGW